MLNRVFGVLFLGLLACAANSQVEHQEVKEFVRIMNQEANVLVLDVRTDVEVAEGMVPGADQLDFYSDNFREELERIYAQNPEATVMIYCRSGGRSASASNVAAEIGFNRVVNMLGGFQAYSKEF